jgi:hypothetical protein
MTAWLNERQPQIPVRLRSLHDLRSGQAFGSRSSLFARRPFAQDDNHPFCLSSVSANRVAGIDESEGVQGDWVLPQTCAIGSF